MTLSAMLAGCAGPEPEPVVVPVKLSGTLSGDDWAIESATLSTSQADVESFVTVTVRRTSDTGSNQTPYLSGTLTTPADSWTCEAPRSYIWSSGPGSHQTIDLKCDSYVYDDELDGVRFQVD